jgi:RNA polymerase sigma-70 factor (ECF subfamily)
MRQILVDYAREKTAIIRGGGARFFSLDEAKATAEPEVFMVLPLNEALNKLELHRPRRAKVFELRFFSGMTVPEVAACVGASERQVVRDWTLAYAWVLKQLGYQRDSDQQHRND